MAALRLPAPPPVVPAPNPVILATPVVPAIGWDDWGDGNPEERRQPP